jgi:gamma-glutamyltranspeptidase/glutathione hydrolase
MPHAAFRIPVLMPSFSMRQTTLVVVITLFSALHAASRAPVAAKHGMVVSVSPEASRVGIEILRRGGNAVDAAVAVGFALAVTHPAAGNIGGGGFMVIHLDRPGQEISLDYRERAPASATRDMYLDQQGNVIAGVSTIGHKAVAVPGSVRGLHSAWQKYGKLKWRELLQPAILLAQNGFKVSASLSASLKNKENSEKLARFAESKKLFLKNGGSFEEGDTLVQKELASTLRRIARLGPAGFYEGPVASLIVDEMRRNGGLITLDDLKNYQAVFRAPVRGTYRGYEVVSMGPPSSGGIALIEMLNMMERFPLRELGLNSSRSIHLKAEIMRRAFADRAKFLGDSDFTRVPVRGLTSKDYAAGLAQTISLEHAGASAQTTAGNPNAYESPETTHYSIIDKDDNAVAATTTLNGSYGSGVTVAGAGFLLNNEMDDFSSKPDAPNAYGLIQGIANAIGPLKRPLSAMTPTIIKREKKIFLITGSPGGPTIMNTVFQIVLNVIDYGLNIQEAVDAPRVHHQWLPDELRAERDTIPEDVENALRARGHKLNYREKIGDAHSILVDLKTRIRYGAADPRSDSLAVGY